MNSAEILTAFETCKRKAFWVRQWDKHRISATEMVRRGVTAAMTVPEAEDFGDYAGEEVVDLAVNRGLDALAKDVNIHASVMNHAAIADIVSGFIRKPKTKPWLTLAPGKNWASSALMDPDGGLLRRFIPVSNWNPERMQHELRSFFTLGEVCMMRRPMQMVVAVLGQLSFGRRHSAWSKAFLHPQHSEIRFKPRARSRVDGFKETWLKVFREEHDEIPRDKWIAAMFEDDVVRDILFVVNVPLPGELEAQRIRDLIAFKLDSASRLDRLPEKQLSVCDGPLSPCQFRQCCWGDPESAPTPGIFDAIGAGAVPTP